MSGSQSASFEEQLLDANGIDREKLAELARILFVMNGWRSGPLPGRYLVICTKPAEEWYVGQLWADQEQPFRLFPELRFTSAEEAETAALALQEQAAGEHEGPSSRE